MINSEKSKLQLEVLISTTNKTSLDFVYKMFTNCDFSKFQILIINQTNKNNILISKNDNIRVINVTYFGLSKSRNLALKNAVGDICLFTDDDVVFDANFHITIVNAFSENKNAGLIAFKVHNREGEDYRSYPTRNKRFNLKSIKGLMSIEIAVRPKIILQKGIRFDERFGLGSLFETGEEYLFGNSVLNHQIPAYFFNSYIVYHDEFNSGMDLGSDKIIFGRGALNYCLYGKWAYFWVLKYLNFLLRNKYISINQVSSKMNIALKGIAAFKKTKCPITT
ncbi:MAG: glycosyltransferase family A protein [Xanthomarina sp.]